MWTTLYTKALVEELVCETMLLNKAYKTRRLNYQAQDQI